MDAAHAITGLVIMLVGAAALVALADRVKQSAIVAYLILGVLVGPSVGGVVTNSDAIGHLADIGVVFLLFFVGLDFHLGEMKKMRGIATAGTVVITTITTAAFGGLLMLTGMSAAAAALVGFALALSSTAIVMKVFDERGQSDSITAQTSLAILLGQDILSLLAVAILPLVAPIPAGTVDEGGGALKLAMLFGGLPLLFFFARFAIPWLFEKAALAKSSEVFGLASLAGCLVVAVGAEHLGASLALGAFLGGLVLAGTPVAYQVRADLTTIRNLTLGFFFVSVGMLVDIHYIVGHIPLVLAGLVILVATKTAIGAAVLRIAGRPWTIAAAIGLALSQVGEFAFVLATTAHQQHLLDDAGYQLVMALSVLSMLPAPTLVASSTRFGAAIGRLLGDKTPPPVKAMPTPLAPAPMITPAGSVAPMRGAARRAVVVGFGPVGRNLYNILVGCGVETTVIDMHMGTVRTLQKLKRPAVFGDATRREILVAAGIDRAYYLVVTVPDMVTRGMVIAMARVINPTIVILSRARYLAERAPLEELAVHRIAFEECEVAAKLARLLLKDMDVEPAKIEHWVSDLRDKIAIRTGFTMVMRRPVMPTPDATRAWSSAEFQDQMKRNTPDLSIGDEEVGPQVSPGNNLS